MALVGGGSLHLLQDSCYEAPVTTPVYETCYQALVAGPTLRDLHTYKTFILAKRHFDMMQRLGYPYSTCNYIQ